MYFILITTIFGIASGGLLPSRDLAPNQDSIMQVQQQKPHFLENTGNIRAQQEEEKNAAILKQTQDVNENGFHYEYETSNGIRAEQISNSVETQGGFRYVGDDGRIYAIIFRSGVDGFRAYGDHLPAAPPTPKAILLALRQNEADEAAGIFDDGLYRSDDDVGDNQLKQSRPSKSSFSHSTPTSDNNSRF